MSAIGWDNITVSQSNVGRAEVDISPHRLPIRPFNVKRIGGELPIKLGIVGCPSNGSGEGCRSAQSQLLL